MTTHEEMTLYNKNTMYCMELYNQEKLKIGDNVTVEWINKEYDFIRFLWGKIIDIDTENTMYKVEYINNICRWESKLNKEWWYKKNLRKRIK